MIPPQLSARAQGVMRFSSPLITPRALFGHASWVPSSAWQLRGNSRAIQIAERRLGTNAGPVSVFPLCHEFPSIRSQDENYVKIHHLIRIQRRERKLVLNKKLKLRCFRKSLTWFCSGSIYDMIKHQKIKTKRFEVDCGFDPRTKFIQNEELEMEMEFDENFFIACSNSKWALYNMTLLY